MPMMSPMTVLQAIGDIVINRLHPLRAPFAASSASRDRWPSSSLPMHAVRGMRQSPCALGRSGGGSCE